MNPQSGNSNNVKYNMKVSGDVLIVYTNEGDRAAFVPVKRAGNIYMTSIYQNEWESPTTDEETDELIDSTFDEDYDSMSVIEVQNELDEQEEDGTLFKQLGAKADTITKNYLRDYAHIADKDEPHNGTVANCVVHIEKDEPPDDFVTKELVSFEDKMYDLTTIKQLKSTELSISPTANYTDQISPCSVSSIPMKIKIEQQDNTECLNSATVASTHGDINKHPIFPVRNKRRVSNNPPTANQTDHTSPIPTNIEEDQQDNFECLNNVTVASTHEDINKHAMFPVCKKRRLSIKNIVPPCNTCDMTNELQSNGEMVIDCSGLNNNNNNNNIVTMNTSPLEMKPIGLCNDKEGLAEF